MAEEIKEVVIPLGEADLYVFEKVAIEGVEVVWTFDGIDIRFIKEEIEEIEDGKDSDSSNLVD